MMMMKEKECFMFMLLRLGLYLRLVDALCVEARSCRLLLVCGAFNERVEKCAQQTNEQPLHVELDEVFILIEIFCGVCECWSCSGQRCKPSTAIELRREEA